jgi:hypothetical protein
MIIPEFKVSLSQPRPPKGLSLLLQALWHEAKGDWSTAHQLAQDVNTPEGAWVHGYLHLKEGDRSNASYWYHHANQSMPATSLEEEWEKIVKQLLQS